ncbi:MAG TPA: sulfite exporter TauE/SafE family protein [Vicinamibacterales bacterium]|nr:sulfite exporter TauE/SafE family protein [Vicinamibacterales bacterium]
MPAETLLIGAATFAAAAVNGALGYGFSSIAVPLALLVYPARVLNPAIVVLEVGINLYTLAANRAAVPAVWPRVRPLVAGLLPGVVGGSLLLASVDADPLKLAIYSTLLPLVLLQAAGWRRPVAPHARMEGMLGAGIGAFYAVTTVSGPPLALLFNNQGLVKAEFRAALGIVRIAESSLTAAAYALLGLYTAESARLLPAIVPGALAAVPIGAALVRHLRAETFRRISMSFDAWIIGFGLSWVADRTGLIAAPHAYAILAAAGVIDAWLLYRYFRPVRGAALMRRAARSPAAAPR